MDCQLMRRIDDPFRALDQRRQLLVRPQVPSTGPRPIGSARVRRCRSDSAHSFVVARRPASCYAVVDGSVSLKVLNSAIGEDDCVQCERYFEVLLVDRQQAAV